VRRPGVDIVYRVRRAHSASPGAPVVFLHGLASNMTRWAELTRETTLGAHHDLIRVDLRGHGESMTRRRFDLGVWGDDLAQLLTDEHATRAYLVGHSLGATLAMAFALERPDRVAGLVLIDPVFREALVPDKALYARHGPLFAFAATLIRALNRIGLYRRRLKPLNLEQLDRQARIALADPGQLEAFVRRYSSAREDLRHIAHASYLQDLVELLRPLPALHPVRAPVLVLRSTIAGYQDPAVVDRRLGELSDCQLEAIHCHHWPVTERPHEVRRLIEDWIDRREGRSRTG
jgi:esterase